MRMINPFRPVGVIVALASSVVAVPAFSAEFKGGNMFIASSNNHRIYEIGPDGEVARTIGVGSGLSTPRGLAFGPDGNLYVGSHSGGQVMVFDAAGAVVRTIGSSAGMSGVTQLAFGAGGRLYVCSSGTQSLFVFDFQGNNLTEMAGSQVGSSTGVTVGPEGNIYFAAGPSLTEFDAGGIEVGFRLLNIFDSEDYGGVVFGPAGLLYASVDDSGDEEVRRYGDQLSMEGDTATDSGDLSGPRGIAFGPNGNLFVVDSGIVKEFDPNPFGKKIQDHAVNAGLSNPYDVAFAPYAFAATVKGKVVRSGIGSKKLKEKKARLQVFPGAVEMSLWFVDDPTSSNDFASVFGADPILFRGFEAALDSEASSRAVMGTEVPGASKASGIASMQLTLTGKKSKKGGVSAGVVSMKGTLHRASPQGVVSATISAKKPLK